MKITDISNLDNALSMIFPDARDHIEMNEDFKKFLIKGWHQAENWPDGKVRWTKKDPLFIMKISANKINLEVTTSKPDIESEPITGEFFCNGIYVGNFTLNEHGWKVLDFNLGNNLRGQVARCKLIMNTTWCPDDFFKSGDKRALGVCVKRIWCE
jgi:hypothetical protein